MGRKNGPPYSWQIVAKLEVLKTLKVNRLNDKHDITCQAGFVPGLSLR